MAGERAPPWRAECLSVSAADLAGGVQRMEAGRPSVPARTALGRLFFPEHRRQRHEDTVLLSPPSELLILQTYHHPNGTYFSRTLTLLGLKVSLFPRACVQ